MFVTSDHVNLFDKAAVPIHHTESVLLMESLYLLHTISRNKFPIQHSLQSNNSRSRQKKNKKKMVSNIAKKLLTDAQ